MPKINQEEYEILKGLDSNLKMLGRNRFGWLIATEENPIKGIDTWEHVAHKETFSDCTDKLFQFIQWEDEEPYNIAELIGEYEHSAEHVSHVVNERLKLVGMAIKKPRDESEEKEVKGLEWAIEEIKKERNLLNDTRYEREVDELTTGTLLGLKKALNILDQLDEPETLSQEWIDKVYKEGYDKGKEYGYQSGYSVGLSSSTHESKFTIYDAHDKIREESILTDKSFDCYWNCIADGVEIDEPKPLDNYEVLSPEWIEEYLFVLGGDEYPWKEAVPVVDLQNLLVPKQFRDEFNSVLQTLPISSDELLSEFKSFVASGGIELKQEEITEMNVNDLAYFITQVENEGLIVIEKPTIPQFVADYIKNNMDHEHVLEEYRLLQDNPGNEAIADWAHKNQREFYLACDIGYTVEEEPKYYARIKGWENVTTGSECFNWVYFKEKDTVGVSKAIENKYQAASFTKNEWENLGINDDNAEFELVEELEE